MGLSIVCCLVSWIFAGAAGAQRVVSSSARPAAIVAGRYLAPDGSIQSDIAVVLADGKIKEVARADELRLADGVVRHPTAVLSPGLIDLRSALGAYSKAQESAYAVDPGVSAIDAVDPHHPDFPRACAAGVTTAVIPPSAVNLVSGAAAVVKLSCEGQIRVLRDDGPLYFALGPASWEPDREPTSRMGALAMLRQVLDDARQGRGHRRIQEFTDGRLDGVVVCEEPADVSAAVRTFGAGKWRLAITYNGDEPTVVEELAAARLPVIFGPLDFASPPRALTLPASLVSAGLPVAFAGQLPIRSGESPRVTAALAVRYGMDSAAARKAITSTAAEIAGISERVGAIRAGLDADLVVFSDDPLRLDARVLEVYIDGVKVYDAEKAPPPSTGEGT